MQAKGLRRPRSASACASAGRSRLLGQQHLAFPEVGQPDDEIAPAVDVAQRRARARRAAPAAGAGAPARARRRAARGTPSRLAWICSSIGSSQRRRAGPRVVQLGKAVRVVGEHRRAAQDQRAFAAQRVVDAGLRQDALDRSGWLPRAARSAPATRRRPAAGAAAGRLRRPAAAPATRAPRPGDRAPSASRTGCARPGRRRLRAGRRPARGCAAASSSPCAGQPLGCARVQPGLLGGRQLREAAPQLVARE